MKSCALFVYLALSVSAVWAAPANVQPKDVNSFVTTPNNELVCSCHENYDPPFKVDGMIRGLCLEVNYKYPGCEKFRYRPHPTNKPTYSHPHSTDHPHPTYTHSTHTYSHTASTTHHPLPTHTPICRGPYKYDHAISACVSIGNGCRDGYRYSTLASACISIDLLHPCNGEGSCEAGLLLDSTLGACLNLGIFTMPHSPKVGVRVNGGPAQQFHRHVCLNTEVLSSITNTCVDLSHYVDPDHNGQCPTGFRPDVLARACLDLSFINNVEGTSAPVQINVGKGDNYNCPLGNRYSTLIAACVKLDLLSAPTSQGVCKGDALLDSILALCIDASVAAGHRHTLANAGVGAQSIGNAVPFNQPVAVAAVVNPLAQVQAQAQVSKSCGQGQRFDPTLNVCVAVAVQAQTCGQGQRFDSSLNVCVDVNVQAPKTCGQGQRFDSNLNVCVAVAVQAPKTCGQGQRFDSTLNVCVAVAVQASNIISSSAPHKCDNGGQFDVSLGVCVNVVVNTQPSQHSNSGCPIGQILQAGICVVADVHLGLRQL